MQVTSLKWSVKGKCRSMSSEQSLSARIHGDRGVVKGVFRDVRVLWRVFRCVCLGEVLRICI